MSTKEHEVVERTDENIRAMLQVFNENLGVHINDNQRFRLGKVLTVIDAAISDPEQRKAIKDLIQSDWWNDNGVGRADGMASPHTDLRGICLALGFELYPVNESAMAAQPAGESDFDRFAANRYVKAISK